MNSAFDLHIPSIIATAGVTLAICTATLAWRTSDPSSGEDSAALADVRAEVAQLKTALESAPGGERSTESALRQSTAAPLASDPAVLARLARAEDLIRQLGATTASAAAGSLDPADGSASAEATEAARRDSLAQDEQRIDALQNSLETQLGTEYRDPQWAPAMEDRLTVALAAETFSGNQISDLRCQSNLCRMEVHSADNTAHGRFVDSYGNLDTFAGTQVFWRRTENGDGSYTTAMYVTRAGTTLPPGNR